MDFPRKGKPKPRRLFTFWQGRSSSLRWTEAGL